MIPRRVYLQGFLSYRDGQEVAFAGASLWMLAGANGSGKSSVFDAVTYTLFGCHRGGSQNAVELVNKESDSFTVEFDFLLDGGLFRARRTLKKRAKGSPASSQQILRHAGGRWEPVPDTGNKNGYDTWIAEHIGLKFETFTASVLLMQGRAEKLLNVTPKDRFEVLAGVVDLERYIRLHARADAERKALKARVEVIEGQLSGLAPVEPAELEAAQARIEAAISARNLQFDVLQQCQQLVIEANRWVELQRERAEFDRRCEVGLALLREAEKIDADATRSRELRAILPHLETAIKQQSRITEAARRRQELEGEIKAAAADSVTAEQEQTRLRTTIRQLDAELIREDAIVTDSAGRVKRLAETVAKVERIEEYQRELEILNAEIGRMPADLAEQAGALQQRVAKLTADELALPHLDRIATEHGRLRQLTSLIAKDESREATIRANGEELKKRVVDAAGRAKTRGDDFQAASAAAMTALTLAQQANEQLALVESMDGAAVCRACGQPLTPAHLFAERQSRTAARAAARQRLAAAEAARAKAGQDRDAADKLANELEKEITQLRGEFREVQGRLTERRDEHVQYAAALRTAIESLPDAIGRRFAIDPGSAAENYPTAVELAAMRSSLEALPGLRQKLDEQQKSLVRLTALREQEARLQGKIAASLAALGGDPAQFRRDHAGAEAEAAAASAKALAIREQAARTRAAAERHEDCRRACAARVNDLNAEQRHTSLQESHDRQLLAAAVGALPENWRPVAERGKLAEQLKLKAEFDALTNSGAETRAAELSQVKAEGEALKARRDLLEAAEAAIPPASRMPSTAAGLRLAEARQVLADRDDALQQSRAALGVLTERQRARHTLACELLAQEGELKSARLLAELLDRNHLQRHLVRTAERQVVDFANAVLDRLSGGQLALRLRGGDDEADKALELEAYNRETGRDPINVAFLSGSQRFRVAVALALGIGQYAGRRHRPIESVIIDEGFGCLDRVGRQAVIQEMQNLRGHLKCVILVSHQEEFAEAFSHGYHFELEDGATQVSPVVR